MKTLIGIALSLVMIFGLTGCSTTNDRGVNINHSTDLFGAAASPALNRAGQPAAPVAKS